MDVTVSKNNSRTYNKIRSIGGVIDLRFFIGGSSAVSLLSRFNQYNGASAIPPFWALGYHQCRWGYKNIDALKNVITNFKKNDIPLDTLWSDLDYMVNSEVFTIDETRFPLDQMKKLIEDYRWIPIIDPGIKNEGPFYEAG